METPIQITLSTQHAPALHARRILLAVSGLSPQIVTETLYALAAQQDAPFVPTEVHLITTREGAQRAELSLLSDDLGWFHRLCTDYHLPGITFRDRKIPEIQRGLPH
jgi:CRISPR-associated protein (TIGR02584 family)